MGVQAAGAPIASPGDAYELYKAYIGGGKEGWYKISKSAISKCVRVLTSEKPRSSQKLSFFVKFVIFPFHHKMKRHRCIPVNELTDVWSRAQVATCLNIWMGQSGSKKGPLPLVSKVTNTCREISPVLSTPKLTTYLV